MMENITQQLYDAHNYENDLDSHILKKNGRYIVFAGICIVIGFLVGRYSKDIKSWTNAIGIGLAGAISTCLIDYIKYRNNKKILRNVILFDEYGNKYVLTIKLKKNRFRLIKKQNSKIIFEDKEMLNYEGVIWTV